MADDTTRPPDDDLGPDAFDGLDLGSLAEGVHPTSARWGEIEADAATRRQRRTWLVAVAAAAVLLLALGTVVAARSGDDRVDVAAGDDGTLFAYVLPPDGAQVIQAEERDRYYSFTYVVDGRAFFFGGEQPSSVAPGTELVAGIITGWPEGLPSAVVRDLGTVEFACPSDLLPPGYQPPSSSEPDGVAPPDTFANGVEWWLAGPPQALWSMGAYAATLSQTGFDDQLCDPETQPDQVLLDGVRQLRTGDRADWEELLAAHPDPDVYTVPATTPPTTPEDPPADRASAEEQIATAVAGLDEVAADGTYPNLEDGSARAEEYRAAIELAGQQSGGDQVPGRPRTLFALTSAHFTSPTRASITYDSTATLPSGTYTFANSGEAVLQDGRWVVSHDTIVTMLARACTPPGGQSKACGAGG